MSNRNYFIVLFVFLLIIDFSVFAQNSSIEGSVVDVVTNQPLSGVTICLKGTNYNVATDIDGRYLILNVSPGIYTLIVRYIGFGTKEIDVKIPTNESVTRNIELDYTYLTDENVAITAQSRGQIETINLQTSALTIKNVIPFTKIQEFPELNAIEAVGRLPGVSLERTGSEGTRLLIRGMESQYSNIQINGVTMVASGEKDRSVDLSMISPYMLESVELTKSVMANQEATATGGIINFKMRKAADIPSFNMIVQGGYNDLRETYDDFKISLGGSNRFFNKKLGVYTQVDYEQKDIGSQQLGEVSFLQENVTASIRTNEMQLTDVFRNVERLSGALILDYVLPSTEIKMSNFYSNSLKEQTKHSNAYNFMMQEFSIGYSDIPEQSLMVLSNSLHIDHRFGNWETNAVFSHSFAENVLPAEISSMNDNSPANPFPPDRDHEYNINLDPEIIPNLLIYPIDEISDDMTVGDIFHHESKTKERDLGGELNFAYYFNILDQIHMKLNFGGKIIHKTKNYDRTDYLIPESAAYTDFIVNLIYDDISERSINDETLYLEDFTDPNYDGSHFLDGKYAFSKVFDKDIFRKLYSAVMQTYQPDESGDLVHLDYVSSNYSDYYGKEDYYAFYVMPEIGITPQFTFVPGIRFESYRTEYTGYRGNCIGILRSWTPTPVDTLTKKRDNEFLLPMIQAVYHPTEWLDIKAGYTHTLQQPNYNYMMPSWLISNLGLIEHLNNFRLKPELSRNWDIQFSVYSDKLGLISVSAFHKRISDMVFWKGQSIVEDTAFFELPSIMYHQRAAYAMNNPNDVYNYGFEIDWQTNFWYLPGLLKNFVLNFNYTRIESKAKYLISVFDTRINPIPFLLPLMYNDTTYTSRMINQPDHLLNLMIGYDYKGFSIRSVMKFKSRILTYNSLYTKLRRYSTGFYRYDLSIRQQLPIKGLEFFLNINNLTDEVEHYEINHMNFTSYLEDYGRSVNVGLRYQL